MRRSFCRRVADRMSPALIHATTVALAVDADGPLAGLAILGPTGSGKSLLALSLIDGCRHSRTLLVADDATIITAEGDKLVASAPDRVKGLLEVRGYGPAPLKSHSGVPLLLALNLADCAARMPERSLLQPFAGGPGIPMFPFVWAGQEGSAPHRARKMAVAILNGQIL